MVICSFSLFKGRLFLLLFIYSYGDDRERETGSWHGGESRRSHRETRKAKFIGEGWHA